MTDESTPADRLATAGEPARDEKSAPLPEGEQPKRPQRASETVASRLRLEILSGAMPAGTKFPPEVELAAAYGVSRPTIREALRFLESDHLVSIRRGKQGGAVVQPPSTSVLARHAGLLLQYRRATLADVFTAKSLIEPPAAAAVARRRDPGAVRQLRDLIALEEEHNTNDELAQELGGRFHDLLVELAGNRTLRIYAAMINDIIGRHVARFNSTRDDPDRLSRRERLLDEHRRLVDLIEVGAALEAQTFWREHLDHFNTLVLSDVPRGTTVLDIMS